jgi:hypothetical protein
MRIHASCHGLLTYRVLLLLLQVRAAPIFWQLRFSCAAAAV